MKRIVILVFVLSWTSIPAQEPNLWMSDNNFCFLDEILDHAHYDVRYAGTNNFIGRPIRGYNSKRLVMTCEAANALIEAEKLLLAKGMGLKIFDTYRPQRAVNHFIEWAKNLSDTLNKQSYYPEHDKSKLFDLGYISSRSGHTRGSTIDLTLFYLETREEVDMGGPYDFFGKLSHHNFSNISQKQTENRLYFKETMSKAGFRSYAKEWWHYTLRNEPYPEQYFDFVVK